MINKDKKKSTENTEGTESLAVSKLPTVLIAYHANCIDGFTSAWVIAKAMKERGLNFTLFPMSYTEEDYAALWAELEAEPTSYTELYVVDFSLPVCLLADLQDKMCQVTVVILDHHKTAFEAYGLAQRERTIITSYLGATIVLASKLSGASLCWEYFNGRKPVPKLIAHVQDWDLWQFQYGDKTRALHYILQEELQCLEVWDRYAKELEISDTYNYIMLRGSKLLTKRKLRVTDLAIDARLTPIAGYEVLAAQCQEPELTSELGDYLAKDRMPREFAAVYRIDTKASLVHWSLRSVGDFDVSVIAKLFGGGGHRNAAGFVKEITPLQPAPKAPQTSKP